jgi:hypothetical protein
MIKIKSKRLLSHSQGGAKNTLKIQTSAPTLILRCQYTPPPTINASEERIILTIFFKKFIFFSFIYFN